MLEVGRKIRIVKKDAFLKGIDTKGTLIPIEKDIINEANTICGKFATVVKGYIQGHLQMYDVRVKGQIHTIYEKDIEHVF